jgi:hypothetical protein
MPKPFRLQSATMVRSRLGHHGQEPSFRPVLSSSSVRPQPPCDPSGEDIDLVRDRVIDGSDLAVLLAEWGTVEGAAAADFNDDGEVDSLDLGLLVGA